jgi:hypothetical protein
VRRCGEAVSATGATRGPRVAVQLAWLEVFPEEQLTAGRGGRQERAEEPMEPAEELDYLWVEGEGDHEDGTTRLPRSMRAAIGSDQGERAGLEGRVCPEKL